MVERTFAWLVSHRRLSKDYEALPATSEALIYIAMIYLMLHRLAPPCKVPSHTPYESPVYITNQGCAKFRLASAESRRCLGSSSASTSGATA